MGIDIRDGQQLGCITCALCIDACDAVMDKLGRERGLISYATMSDYTANLSLATAGGSIPVNPRLIRDAGSNLSGKIAKFRIGDFLRPRTVAYAAAWSIAGLLMLYGLLTRDRLEVNVIHDRNPQYVRLSDGAIRNGYTLKVLNMIPERRTILVTLQGLRGADMTVIGLNQPDDRSFAAVVEPDRAKSLKLFIRQPIEFARTEHQTFKFIVEDKASYEKDEYVASFNAPGENLK
jgi:polyferredoxin